MRSPDAVFEVSAYHDARPQLAADAAETPASVAMPSAATAASMFRCLIDAPLLLSPPASDPLEAGPDARQAGAGYPADGRNAGKFGVNVLAK